MDNLIGYATQYLEQKKLYHSCAFTEDFMERVCIMADSLENKGAEWLCHEAYTEMKRRGKK